MALAHVALLAARSIAHAVTLPRVSDWTLDARVLPHLPPLLSPWCFSRRARHDIGSSPVPSAAICDNRGRERRAYDNGWLLLTVRARCIIPLRTPLYAWSRHACV